MPWVPVLVMNANGKRSFSGLRTSRWEKGVVSLITPRTQLVGIFIIWKVILRVIAGEKKRAKPDGLDVVVVFGD